MRGYGAVGTIHAHHMTQGVLRGNEGVVNFDGVGEKQSGQSRRCGNAEHMEGAAHEKGRGQRFYEDSGEQCRGVCVYDIGASARASPLTD